MYNSKTRTINRWVWYITFKIWDWWKKSSYDYNTLLLKFENDNKIFEKYKDFFILLDETIDKNFTDKYKSFIDEYEEEYEKIRDELNKTGWNFFKYIFRNKNI